MSHELADATRLEILQCLTRPGSQFSWELFSLNDSRPIAVVQDDSRVLSWAASDFWSGFDTLECFTREDCRRSGLALAAAAALAAFAGLQSRRPIAVFSADAYFLAEKAGFRDIRTFRRVREGKWVPCPTPRG